MPRDARNVPVTVADSKLLNGPQTLAERGTNGNGHGHTNGNGHAAMEVEIVPPASIVKRDGRVVPFDVGRIEDALTRCFAAFEREPATSVQELAHRVINIVAAKANGDTPTVEGVQDIVEMVLQAAGEFEAAKRYILYRADHERQREERPIPEEVREAFSASDPYFPTPLQRFQFFDKYSRFNYDLGRRETWIETVGRAVDFLHELAGDRLPAETYERVRRGILVMRVMPSMRLLAMAGAAARRKTRGGGRARLPREAGDPQRAPPGGGRPPPPPQQHHHLQLLLPARREHRLVLRGADHLDERLRGRVLRREQVRRGVPPHQAPDRRPRRSVGRRGLGRGLGGRLALWFGALVRRRRRPLRHLADPAGRSALADQGRPGIRPGAAPAHARLHAPAHPLAPGLVPAPDRRPRHDVRRRIRGGLGR